jgi:ElaB/YqjD/DUF883 family membrane-anchored ribosome-binding protein
MSINEILQEQQRARVDEARAVIARAKQLLRETDDKIRKSNELIKEDERKERIRSRKLS